MRCKCSLDNNYEVIGLCNIKKFNEKIQQCADRSWTQIIIPEILEIPFDYPDIESITKVYLDIKITSQRIANSPSAKITNIEGLKLSGKMLLVFGYLCQNIIYVSDTKCQSMHSIKFKIPFNTYIIIDKDTDEYSESFCIYPCIENVFIKPLNKRTISKSVSLFLFANKILNNEQDITNTFVFKNYTGDADVAIVYFNISDCKRKLVVESTGENYRGDNPSRRVTFDLRGPNKISRAKGTINFNEDASNFKDDLNDIPFNYGDLIYVEYVGDQNAILTDYPTAGDRYFMGLSNKQGFRITTKGVVPYILPNTIWLNGVDNLVFELQFDVLFQIFLLTPYTGTVNATIGNPQYFIISLESHDGIQKAQYAIQIGGNVGDFPPAIHAQEFEFGDNLYLYCTEPGQISITDIEREGTVYNPTNGVEGFKITEDGLAKIEIEYPAYGGYFDEVAFLNDNGEDLATINFTTVNNMLSVISTGNIQPGTPSRNILQFRLYNSDGTRLKESAVIQSNRAADQFAIDLNNNRFWYGDIISLGYGGFNERVEIRDTITGETFNPVFTDTQEFVITPEGLTINILPTQIVLNTSNNQEIVVINFAKFGKKLKVIASGDTAPDSFIGSDYFKVTLKNPAGVEKNAGVIEGGEDGFDFEAELNDKVYDASDIIEIFCEEPDRVEINNLKGQGEIYHPRQKTESFIITEKGLIKI